MGIRALEHTQKTLTQNTWVKLVDDNGGRKAFEIETEDSSKVVRIQNPERNNPFALTFNGTSTSIDTSAILSSPNTVTESVSGRIHARVKISSLDATNQTIFSISDANVNEILRVFIFGTTDKLGAELIVNSTTQWQIEESDGPRVTGEWYEFTLKHDGKRPILLIDNSEVKWQYNTSTDLTKWVSGMTVANLDTALVGANSFNGAGTANFFDGMIDYVRMDGKSATDKRANAYFHYELDEGTGTTAIDRGSFDDNGTIANGAWGARNTGFALTSTIPKRYFTKHDDGQMMQRSWWGWTDDAAPPDVTFIEFEFNDHYSQST